MFCTKCGVKIEEDTQFCSSCGMKMDNAISSPVNSASIGDQQKALFYLARSDYMKIFGILLLIIGIIGVFLASMMFGDIGIAALIGAATAIVTGIGFIKLNKTLKL